MRVALIVGRKSWINPFPALRTKKTVTRLDLLGA